jgi:hypothetical protein
MLGTVFADLSARGEDEFWVFLDIRGWVHPYDTAGRRCAYNAISEPDYWAEGRSLPQSRRRIAPRMFWQGDRPAFQRILMGGLPAAPYRPGDRQGQVRQGA